MNRPPTQSMEVLGKRRRLVRVALILILVILALCCGLGYRWLAQERELREAIAEADRLDPGWRLSELEARRDPILDEKKAAFQVLAVPQPLPARCAPPK